MTKKLYYEDAYMRAFEATVTEVSGSKAVFDQTAFYPEGGGQPADHGTINVNGKTIKVLDVHENDNIIWHTLSEPVNVGDKVCGEIDWDRRFDHMQQHSGEHIVSGLICAAFNCDNVGFHMGDDVITIDYNARITYEQALEIEEKANKYIWENHEFEVLWPTAEELEQLDYRSKKELSGDVRIARFPGADCCACCGTHVKSSAEVGLVKLTSAHNFHEGTRLELYCGRRALTFLSMNYDANKAVAVLLSTKEDKTPAVVEKQIKDYLQLKTGAALIEEKYFQMWADSLKGEDNVLIISDWMSADQGRKFADMVSDICGGITAVFTPAGDSSSYRYSLINKGADISAFVKEMNAALNGRGGGRSGFAQGTVTSEPGAIQKFFKEIS